MRAGTNPRCVNSGVVVAALMRDAVCAPLDTLNVNVVQLRAVDLIGMTATLSA